jgi:hypothetical protein
MVTQDFDPAIGRPKEKTESFKQKMEGAKISFSDDIIFEDIPILSPNGDILVPKMSFKI